MENTEVNKQRETGLDIVKSIAAFFVIGVHFYLNCGYYSEPLITKKLFVMTNARWLFMICVPLYIMVTGYLKSNKTICKKHYMSLIPLFIAYFVINIYKMLVVNHVFGNLYTMDFAIRNLANYQIAWYMGMYLSLVLIIPFLNMMWKGCKDKSQHRILIGSFAFVSMLYPIFLYIVPSYWQMLYPIVYYFLGTYLYVYRPKANKLFLIATMLVMVLFESCVSWHFAKGGNFDWTILGPTDNGYSTITVAITAICMFMLFYDVQINNKLVASVFKSIAGCTFEIYLFSGAYDMIIFYYLKRYIFNAQGFFWWFFVTVPASFILAWISSLIYKLLYKKISRLVVSLFSKREEKLS